MLDPSGRVATWNEGAERIKGYKASEIIGRHFSAFYLAEENARGKPDWELRVAAAEGRFEDEGWRVRNDGTLFWANVIITALRSPRSGELVGFAKVTRDLTERRAAQERAISDARRVAEAETANRAKADFLAAVSHELRTPLNAIAGYAELLALGLRGPVSQAQLEDLERIRRSQRHLLAIVNDLLNFSKIEAGKVVYSIEPVPLDELVGSVAGMVELQASAKHLKFAQHGCAPNVVARADRPKVEQVLLNLLSNAVKFTPPGGKVTVSCAVDGDTVVLTVEDTGPGIPADKLETIFEPFVQLGRTFTTTHEGAGLGLAISRELARAMGGDLTVESRLGTGSAFTVRLPREEA
jgi:PAS domain S-box-containing protein